VNPGSSYLGPLKKATPIHFILWNKYCSISWKRMKILRIGNWFCFRTSSFFLKWKIIFLFDKEVIFSIERRTSWKELASSDKQKVLIKNSISNVESPKNSAQRKVKKTKRLLFLKTNIPFNLILSLFKSKNILGRTQNFKHYRESKKRLGFEFIKNFIGAKAFFNLKLLRFFIELKNGIKTFVQAE